MIFFSQDSTKIPNISLAILPRNVLGSMLVLGFQALLLLNADVSISTKHHFQCMLHTNTV